MYDQFDNEYLMLITVSKKKEENDIKKKMIGSYLLNYKLVLNEKM